MANKHKHLGPLNVGDTLCEYYQSPYLAHSRKTVCKYLTVLKNVKCAFSNARQV